MMSYTVVYHKQTSIIQWLKLFKKYNHNTTNYVSMQVTKTQIATTVIVFKVKFNSIISTASQISL